MFEGLFPRSVVVFACLQLASAQGLYYQLETVAATGSSNSDGEPLTAIERTSINESGIIAFTANIDGPTPRTRLHRSGVSDTPIGFGPTVGDNRSVGWAQINAAGEVASWERFLVGTPRHSYIRIWNAHAPGGSAPTPVLTTQNSALGLSAILPPVSLANDGTILFVGFSPRKVYLNTNRNGNSKTDVGTVISNGQPWLSSGGRYVLREGEENFGLLSVDGPSESRRTLATTADAQTVRIGNLPGISDTGKVIAYVLEDTVEGQGIYLWIDDPAFPTPVKVLGYQGMEDGLGFNDTLNPVRFFQFDFTNRVAVEHREAGPPGIEGDEILLSFIATPTGPSFTNVRTNEPMLYTSEPALWTVHLNPSRALDGTGPIRLDNKTSPMPVIQIGSEIDGQTVTGISIYDPLAFAEKTGSGVTRTTIGPADHYITCKVTTSSGERVLRATQLDSDNDGLFDHWEEPGGGIDVNRDGVIDLELAEFGADPMRRDLFVEIDWLAPWRPESYTDSNDNGAYDLGEPYVDSDGNGKYSVSVFAPDKLVLDQVAAAYANAPVPNPVGPPGITLHIDAGPSRSVNLPASAVLDGGDEIVDPDTGKHILVIYGDPEDYTPVPSGTTDEYGNPVIEAASQDLRDLFCGGTDLNARELAFKYVIFGNLIGAFNVRDATGLAEAPLFARRVLVEAETFTNTDDDPDWFEGDQFLDSNGNGTRDAGEAFYGGTDSPSTYDPPEPFVDLNGDGTLSGAQLESSRAIPGNSVIIGLGGTSSSLTRMDQLRVLFPLAGVPDFIPTPPGFMYRQVLHHELGHTLGLNHGGADNNTGFQRLTPKPEYRSIMNYGYTDAPDRDGSLVGDYSATDANGSFNDWAIVRFDSARHFDGLGVHTLSSRFQDSTTPDYEPQLTLRKLENLHGPLGPVERASTGFIIDLDLTDDDRDGVVLLVEVALGTDPNIPDRQNHPITSGIETVGDVTRHYFTYPRDTSAGINYVVERSTNLSDWSSAGMTETILSTSGSVQIVKASAPASPPDRTFFRLNVTRQP